MVKTAEERAFQERIAKLDQQVAALDQIGEPQAQASARELLRAVLDLHSAGLERMLDVIYESGVQGQAMIDALAQDELVSSLLLLHDLHPLDLETRVLGALEKVRPYMQSHGGGVELLEVTDRGVVKLRLEGSCHGCPSSRVTLRFAVEEAISKAAPDVTAIEVEGVVESPAHIPNDFIPAAQLTERIHKNGSANKVRQNYPSVSEKASDAWISVNGLATLRAGTIRLVNVSDMPILFCRVDQTLYAYASTCPYCGAGLATGALASKDICCAECGHRYEVTRAGRDVADTGIQLEPFPLLEQAGNVRIALPVLQVQA